MSAQRTEITEERRKQGEEAIASLHRLHEALRDANPDFTDDDWDRLAEEWAEEVNEGLRNIVRRSRGESTSRSS